MEQHELAGKEPAAEAGSRTLEANNVALKAERGVAGCCQQEPGVAHCCGVAREGEAAAAGACEQMASDAVGPGAAAVGPCQTMAHADGRPRLQIHRGLRERGGASCEFHKSTKSIQIPV